MSFHDAYEAGAPRGGLYTPPIRAQLTVLNTDPNYLRSLQELPPKEKKSGL